MHAPGIVFNNPGIISRFVRSKAITRKRSLGVTFFRMLVPLQKSSEDKTPFLTIISSVYWIKSSGMSHMKAISFQYSKWYLKNLKIVWYFENEYSKKFFEVHAISHKI